MRKTDFDAADQIANIYQNVRKLGTHRSGYKPFSFYITKHLQKTTP